MVVDGGFFLMVQTEWNEAESPAPKNRGNLSYGLGRAENTTWKAVITKLQKELRIV